MHEVLVDDRGVLVGPDAGPGPPAMFESMTNGAYTSALVRTRSKASATTQDAVIMIVDWDKHRERLSE